MQVALLRGHSQLEPVQPVAHTHWPMEQCPRAAEMGREGRGEPHSYLQSWLPTCWEALWELTLGSQDVPSQGQRHLFLTALEFPSLLLSISILLSTFHSAARVTVPKHKCNHVSPLFKNSNESKPMKQ